MKNPLLPVSLFFCFNTMMYFLPLATRLARGMTFGDFLTGNVVKIIGFSLSLFFLISYLRKSILAWWVASLFLGIMFVAKFFTKNEFPDIRFVFGFLVMYFLVLTYLWSKFDLYRKYIADNGMSNVFEVLEAKEISSQGKIANSELQNPLQTVMGITVTLAIFELSYLFPTGQKPSNFKEILMFFSPQTFVLLLLFILLISYYRKNILAWWISMIHIPLMWIVYNSFNPFNIIQFAITAFIFVIMACYLIMKYESYRAYIGTEDGSKNL